MKKIIALLAVFMMFTACDSDDDANEGEDPILGTWFIIEVNNVPGNDFTLSDCNTESYITFNSDGTTTSQYYSEVEGECMASEESNSVWSKSNDIYSFTLPLEGLEGFENLSGTAEFSNNQFIFTPTLSPSTKLVFERR